VRDNAAFKVTSAAGEITFRAV
jgi:hypothetical protein